MTIQFRRILMPHDFSEPADAALDVAADLAVAQRGRLTVLHVLEPFHPPVEVFALVPPQAREIGPPLKRLEEVVASRIGRRRVPVQCRVVVGYPIAAILDAARDADLIVMATQGRTGLAHLLIGSVAERVVRHSSTPVLTVHAGRGTTGRKRRRSRRAVARTRGS
jgi:universal stress protein A